MLSAIIHNYTPILYIHNKIATYPELSTNALLKQNINNYINWRVNMNENILSSSNKRFKGQSIHEIKTKSPILNNVTLIWLVLK